jgi:putative FmdB family regulatory protein
MMPCYNYECVKCSYLEERIAKIEERDNQRCLTCEEFLVRLPSVPAAPQFRGRVVQGGGPDRFTADAMGIPLKELPVGLRTPQK